MAISLYDSHDYDDTIYAGLIDSIQLPGMEKPYQLHDPDALHDVAELGLASAIVFGGVVATRDELPALDNTTVGTVYYIQENDQEVICVEVDGEKRWENFGAGVSLDHIHDVTGKATGSLSNANVELSIVSADEFNAIGESSTVTGTVTVTGENESSEVTGSGSVTVPSVYTTKKYIKLTSGSDTFVKSYSVNTQKLEQSDITTAGSATEVVKSITPNTTEIAGVSGKTSASKVATNVPVTVAQAGSAVTVPNVTSNADRTASKVSATNGSAASWSAQVTGTTLSFNWIANTPTTVTSTDVDCSKVTLGEALSITPAVDNGQINNYTFSEVDVPVAASAVSVVTGIQAPTASVATVGDTVTVATGKLSNAGTGDAAAVGLTAPVTGSAVITAEIGAGTDSDIYTGDGVTVSDGMREFSITGTAAAQKWTQKSSTINADARAAAQNITLNNFAAKATGSVTVSGELAVTGTTGSPKVS